MIISKKEASCNPNARKNAEIFEGTRDTFIRMLISARKKILHYFTYNNRNKQPFIVALNLSQSKQPRMIFSRVLRSRIR